MEADFAILPFPKFNEDQETYITSVRDSFMAFCIPSNNDDSEFTGTITEALCVSGSEYVFPVYYDVLLKGKTVRDKESSEMLDIIKDSLFVEFIYAYATMLDNIHNVYNDLYTNNQELPSYWARRKTSLEKKLEDLLAKLS